MTIRVRNQLPEATSVHWHGLDVPNRMDCVPAVEPSYIGQGQFYDMFKKVKRRKLGVNSGVASFYIRHV
ncbi:hypothetical protein BC351_03285 [Paenibacillus ferrarius]|uniref:Plastocyanin-like domain-containing protein n=1 Tax=Paenibacillus ferrarius TaxID=1469647 RepID=A0A1V4HJW9_9BACL|nr:hypothetical protein BC351_03285 [Paenibacillus ferrarius]